MAYVATVEIQACGGNCILGSNGIPNHDFNVGGSFAIPVSEVNETFSLSGSPAAPTVVPISSIMTGSCAGDAPRT